MLFIYLFKCCALFAAIVPTKILQNCQKKRSGKGSGGMELSQKIGDHNDVPLVILGHSWAILGHFGLFGVIFGPLWATLGHFWPFLGNFVAFRTNLRKVQIFLREFKSHNPRF